MEKFVDEDGLLHNDNGPAVITDNGGTQYFKHGNRHRLDGPAIDYEDMKYYFVDGLHHRIDGPAALDINDKFTDVKYFQHDKLHRTDGPARYRITKSGNISSEHYFLFGVQMQKTEWEAEVELLKLSLI